MASTFFLAVSVSILPAMAALWWLLDRYEGHFEDARVFFSLSVGFFLGLAATAFEFLAFPFHDPQFVAAMGVVTGAVFFIAGYAFFETGAKVIALGLRKFRQRRDTPYYGTALGFGFGAMAALLFVSVNLNAAQTLGTPYRLLPFLAMMAVPLGGVLAHGATGAWVGKGSADGTLWRGWGVGTLLQMPIMALYWLFWPSLGRGNTIVIVPALAALAYGIFLLAWTDRRVLSQVVPPEVRARLARERRREARAAAAAPAGVDDDE